MRGSDCAAFGCDYLRKGYSGKRSVFSFPLHDKERLEKWIRNLRRKDFQPTKWSKLCEIHFDDHCILKESSAVRPDGTTVSFKLAKPRLSDNAIIPTRFPVLYTVRTESGDDVNGSSSSTPKRRTDPFLRKRKAEFNKRKMAEEKNQSRTVSTIDEIFQYLNQKKMADSWNLFRKTEVLYLYKLEEKDCCIVMEKNVTISVDLTVKLFTYEHGEPVESYLPKHLSEIESFDCVDELLMQCEILISCDKEGVPEASG